MVGGEEASPERDRDEVSEVVGLLLQRGDFLDRLWEGTADKPELIESVGVSRSTADRALKELQLEGIVEKRSDGYALTLYGRMTVRSYRRLYRRIENMRLSKDSLRTLPSSTDLDPVFFSGGRVISEDEGDRKPSGVIRDLLEEAEAFWTVTKSPHFELIQLAHRRVVHDDMEFKLVHSDDSIERLNLHYPDIVRRALESGNLTMYSLDTAPPFGMIKAARSRSETVAIVLYGRKGTAETLVVNETRAARDRFDEFFRECLEDASEVAFDD